MLGLCQSFPEGVGRRGRVWSLLLLDRRSRPSPVGTGLGLFPFPFTPKRNHVWFPLHAAPPSAVLFCLGLICDSYANETTTKAPPSGQIHLCVLLGRVELDSQRQTKSRSIWTLERRAPSDPPPVQMWFLNINPPPPHSTAALVL